MISKVSISFLALFLVFSWIWSSESQARDLCPTCQSPIRSQDADDFSAISQYVSKKQIEQISRELYQPATSVRSSTIKAPETVHVQAQISSEPFDLKKFASRKKALAYDSPPDSALFLVFQMPSGFSTRTEGSNEVRLESSASNSMVNPVELERKDGATRFQENHSVGQTHQLTIEKGNRDMSLEISARVYELLDRPDLIFYPVSDDVIEKAHTALGAEDPFGRKKNGLMNRMVVDLRDPHGNTFHGEKGQTYILPLVVRLKNFDRIEALSSADGKKETTLVTGVQGSVPVGTQFRQAGVGTFATLVQNRALTDKLLLTIAAGVGVNVQRTLGGYQPTDSPTSINWNGNFAVGLTCLGKGEEKTSLSITFDSKSGLLNRGDYKEPNKYLSRLSADAASEPDHSVGLAVAHQTANQSTYKFECREDFGGPNRLPKTMGGLNNRDFSCSATFSKSF